jgi:hypothetical protein
VQAVGELTRITRTSCAIASSILRTFSAWRTVGGQKVEAGDFRGPFHQPGDVGAKARSDFCGGDARVFHDVVQQRGAQRGYVQAHVRQDVGHLQGMRQKRLAGLPQLRLVLLAGEFIGAAQQVGVVAGAVRAHLGHQLVEARIHRALRRFRHQGLRRRGHIRLL